MSRSYRHNVVFAYDEDKTEKKFANRKVRRSKDIFQNGDYKKVYDSWLIRLGKWRYLREYDYILEELRYGGNVKDAKRKFRAHLRSK